MMHHRNKLLNIGSFKSSRFLDQAKSVGDANRLYLSQIDFAHLGDEEILGAGSTIFLYDGLQIARILTSFQSLCIT